MKGLTGLAGEPRLRLSHASKESQFACFREFMPQPEFSIVAMLGHIDFYPPQKRKNIENDNVLDRIAVHNIFPYMVNGLMNTRFPYVAIITTTKMAAVSHR